MILVVAATELELAGVEGADTLCCGIGPVEAGIATTAWLARSRSRAVLHVGIAGSVRLPPRTVVIGSEAVYCDLVDPASVLPRVDRTRPAAALVEAAKRAIPDATIVPVATSARIGGGTSAIVEAMEGFAVLRAAELADVPAVEVRTISNSPADADRSVWRIQEALTRLREILPPLISEVSACVD